MYFECETWLGEKWICKLNLFQSIIILLFGGSGHLIKVKKLSKKDLIFDD